MGLGDGRKRPRHLSRKEKFLDLPEIDADFRGCLARASVTHIGANMTV